MLCITFLHKLLSPCHAMGSPKNQSDQNIKYQTKFSLNIHEISSCRLGVMDTSCVCPFLYKSLSPCYAMGNPTINLNKI